MRAIHWFMIFAILATATTVNAAPKKKKNNPDKWKIADAAMWDQLQAKRTEATFKKFDKDNSDSLDREEFEKLLRGGDKKAGNKGDKPKKKPGKKKAGDKKKKVNATVFIAAKAPAKKDNAKKGKPKGDAGKGLGGAGVDKAKWFSMSGPNRLFDKLDKDEDNVLSKKEFVSRDKSNAEKKPGRKEKP